MQWPSLDTAMTRGRWKSSGASRARRRSPVMVWTRHGPSAKATTQKIVVSKCCESSFNSIIGLTFGSTDDQAKFCTHRHTHDFLVVARQNGSRCWVVALKARHTTKVSLSRNIIAGQRDEPPWRLSELSCKCSNAYWSSNHLILPPRVTWLMMARGEVSEGRLTAAKHKYCRNDCAAVAPLMGNKPQSLRNVLSPRCKWV